MSEHTPGPWSASNRSWCDTYIIAPTFDHAICCLDINHATEESQEADEAQMAANARLISAAPDLLAAVLAYVEHFERHRITNTHGARDFDFTGQIASMARAAIAKATGAAL